MKAFSVVSLVVFLGVLSVPTMAESVNHSGVKVLQAAEAEYPRTALRRGQTGEVLVEYSINEQGRAEDIRVLDSGARVFESAAVRAVEESIYIPVQKDGNLVKVEGVQRRFVFELPN